MNVAVRELGFVSRGEGRRLGEEIEGDGEGKLPLVWILQNITIEFVKGGRIMED